MFARRAAAEVFARQQNAGTFEFGLIQNEVRIWLLPRIIQKTPVVKQVLTKAGASHFLQKLLRNNGVSIDVGGV